MLSHTSLSDLSRHLLRRSRSPWFWGAALGLTLLVAWAAWTYVPRAPLVGATLVSAPIGLLLLRYPVLLAATAAFLITGSVPSYLPSSFTPVLLLAVVLVLIRKVLVSDLRVRVNPVLLWAILLFTWQIFSVVWAGSCDWYTLSGFYRGVLTILLVTWVIESPSQLRLVIAGAAIGMLMTAVLTVQGLLGFFESGVISEVSGLSQHAGAARFFGQWPDPNQMSLTLVPFAALCYALMRSKGPVLLRLSAGLATVASFVAVLLSMSRSGIICLLVLLALVISADRHRWVLGFAATAVMWLIISYAPIDVMARAATLTQGTADTSIGQRTQLAVAGLKIAANKFPFGVGLGNFRTYSADYVRSAMRGYIPHNTYAELLSETGPIGLILFLGAIGSAFFSVKTRGWRIDSETPAQNMAVCLKSAVLMMMVAHLFLSFSTYAPYWFVVALCSQWAVVFPEGNMERRADDLSPSASAGLSA